MTSTPVTSVSAGRLGMMIDRSTAPERLVPLCRALDAASAVDDVWVVEDVSWGGASR